MASGVRLLAHADFVNRCNGLLSFRISKVVNKGRNSLSQSAANYSTASEPVPEESKVDPENQPRINKAVAAYLKRAKEYETFIKEQTEEFEKGKKFLARIMGKDSESFTQQQIDEAIEYLFPSGLYEPLARPMMKHPELLYAKRKEAQFDETGRPFHYLFYTTKPNFNQALHECSTNLHKLNEKLRSMGPLAVHPKVPLNIVGSTWLNKAQLEKMLLENILESEYEKFIEAMERLAAHPYAFEVASFIMQYRQVQNEKTVDFPKPVPVQIGDNLFAVEVDGCRRKKCTGKVKLIKPGTGKLSINGKSLIDFFEELQPRQERMASGESEPNRKRSDLNRAISFHNEIYNANKKYETGSNGFLSRLKSLRGDRRHKSVGDPRDTPTALDDIVFLESFEESEASQDRSIIVCRDTVRQNLLECMKTKNGNVDLLLKIENGDIDAEEVLESATEFELNVAFLWVILLRKRDMMPVLMRKEVDLSFSEPQQGFGPLHISALTGCTSCTELLLNYGMNANLTSGSYTPLHCAAFGNSVGVAKMLLRAGATLVPKPSVDGTGCLETPVHSAVRARALDCIRLFITEKMEIDSTGYCGFTPLHLAADLGYAQCLQVLLDSQRCDINLQTNDRKNSALHLAAENGFADCVKLLLENGADVGQKNYRHQTPLHVAARIDLECVNLLLKFGSDPNCPDADSRTPLHSAVGKSECEFSLDITKSLIASRGDVNRKDKYGYTSLHVAALTELSDCVECLILQGADVTARTRGGTTALSIICRKTPSALISLRQKLDECITIQDSDGSSRDLLLRFNFRYLIQNCQSGEISFLQTFVDEGQKELLEHPLCQAFLYLKWQKIRKYYIARLIFGFIHVLLFSIYVIMALAYQCYNDSIAPESKSRILNVDLDLCAKKSFFGDFLRNNPLIMEIEWFILLFFTVLEIFRKVYGFSGYRSFYHYVSQKDNIAEWIVVASVFLTSFVYTGQTYIWQNHVGALAVLCGWANLMVMIGNLPIFGVYVTMYMKVQKEFTKLFLAYICLLIGFTVCFCVIFPNTQQFSNPFIAIIKILVMMTGELEFDNLLENITNERSHPIVLLEISAFTAFILFLLFVTIILMNLLIGIAVHDIQGLQKTAGLSKLVGQTKLISHIESALFNGCLPGCMLKLLQVTALISPSSYRVVFSVKPLNPRETLLPKNVMRQALEVANQKRGKSSCSRWTTMRKTKTIDDYDGDMLMILMKLTQEVEKLKEAINEKEGSKSHG